MPTTVQFGWAYPTVGADLNTWGGILNGTIIAIDAALATEVNKVQPIVLGGTGAITALGARTTLGVRIGVDVQAWSADLDAIAANVAPDSVIAYNAAGDLIVSAFVPLGRTLVAQTTQAGMRATIGVDAALGFTPVQQNGFPNTAATSVKVGWGTVGNPGLRADVDGVELGALVRRVVSGSEVTGLYDEIVAPGNAPLYGCRAWVNFDGTTGTIKASGNVASLTRNGVGDYTINFTTAMPDANYAFSGAIRTTSATAAAFCLYSRLGETKTTGSFRFRTGFSTAFSDGDIDSTDVNLAIFR